MLALPRSTNRLLSDLGHSYNDRGRPSIFGYLVGYVLFLDNRLFWRSSEVETGNRR